MLTLLPRNMTIGYPWLPRGDGDVISTAFNIRFSRVALSIPFCGLYTPYFDSQTWHRTQRPDIVARMAIGHRSWRLWNQGSQRKQPERRCPSTLGE